MEYVLGMDSGGTKYLVRAADLDGNLLGMDEGQAANHYMQSLDEVKRLIDESIDRCLAQFGGKREDCVYMLSGSTGCDSEEDQQLLHDLYTGLCGFACPVYCVNDAELAHYTATGGVGLLLVAGTGSIAFGRNASGETRRVGGWPLSVMGEEGSGRFVDAWAMHEYTRFLDGVRPKTPMMEAIRSVTGVSTAKEMMEFGMAMFGPPHPTPRLGALVNASAEQGDACACAILKRAAQGNFDLLQELAGALSYDPQDAFSIGLWGSTILKGTYQRRLLTDLLSEAFPNASIVIAPIDAAQGAVRWAIERYRAGE
ncbi:MAG: N-acetylglucosamine kinase [Clostridia bacterium]|nr:N-acetylglucosamine kinase [Clostridia bacterium]